MTITTPEQMREAAIAACKNVADEAKRYGIPQMTMGANICYDAIRAIPIAPQPVTVTADPLSDPRVVALVEAAKRALNNLENTESEFGITLESADSLRAALRAIGGEA